MSLPQLLADGQASVFIQRCQKLRDPTCIASGVSMAAFGLLNYWLGRINDGVAGRNNREKCYSAWLGLMQTLLEHNPDKTQQVMLLQAPKECPGCLWVMLVAVAAQFESLCGAVHLVLRTLLGDANQLILEPGMCVCVSVCVYVDSRHP